MRRTMFVLVLLAVSVPLTGCRQEARPATLEGVVISVQPASFMLVGTFTLRTNDGQMIELSAEGDIGITAGHMREHMTLADPVVVTVRYEGDRVFATRVDDAPVPAQPAGASRPGEHVEAATLVSGSGAVD